jgi:hypothetical protein
MLIAGFLPGALRGSSRIAGRAPDRGVNRLEATQHYSKANPVEQSVTA